jgi:hypothetical protein
MKKIKILLKNFKGISELDLDLDLNVNCHLIYAPNGTGKTSLLSSFTSKKISKKNPLTKKDTSVLIDDDINFVCFESFNSKNLTYGKQLFLETMEDEDRVNDMLLELDSEIDKLSNLKMLKLSYGDNFQYELIKDIKEKDKKNKKISNIDIEFYKVFFSKTTNQKEINYTSLNDLISFIEQYKKIMLIDNVNLTKSQRDTSKEQCISLLSKEKKEGNKEFIQILSGKIAKLNNESNLQNKKIEVLKENFKKNKLLSDIDIMAFLENNIDYFNDIKNIEILNEKRDLIEKWIVEKNLEYTCKVIKYVSEYNRIKEKEKEEDLEWRDVCDEYNSIFINSPIQFKLEKSHDRISRKDTNKIVFSIKNPLNENFIGISEKFLWSELSEGEKRSLYFFDLMHKVREYIKRYGNDVIFIFDDIIDNLDDFNQMSLTYYFKKLAKMNVKFLILTHNYNFYNVLGRKIIDNKKMLSMFKSTDGKILFRENDILSDSFLKTFLNLSIFEKPPEYLISLIPIIREIQKISLNENENEIIKYLHIKRETVNTSFDDLVIFMKNKIEKNTNITSSIIYNDSYLNVLHERCEHILKNQPTTLLEDLVFKICLSIGIRLMLEKKIIDKISDFEYDIHNSQTNNLIIKYSSKFKIDTLNLVKYEMASSNIIHLNSLNYEVLFHYNLEYLKKMYIDLNSLKI